MTPLEQAVFDLIQHNGVEPLMDSPQWDAWSVKQRELIQAVWTARLEQLGAQMNADHPGKVGADF